MIVPIRGGVSPRVGVPTVSDGSDELWLLFNRGGPENFLTPLDWSSGPIWADGVDT